MDALLKELNRIEKNFDIYFSDPINSDLKPKDFMVSQKFLINLGPISTRLNHFNKLLMRDEYLEFLEDVLGNAENDKITKIQQYFIFKQTQKSFDLIKRSIRFNDDCE